jgi:hypothetical protein
MSEKGEAISLPQQLAQKVIDDLIKKNLLHENTLSSVLRDKITAGEITPEDWKSELERAFDSLKHPRG